MDITFATKEKSREEGISNNTENPIKNDMCIDKNKDIKENIYALSLNFSRDLINDINFRCLNIIFKSIYNKLILVYINEDDSVVSYDLNNFEKIIEIKDLFYSYIVDLKYICDYKNKRDLVMICCYNNEFQVWDFNKVIRILNIEIDNNNGCHNLFCFLNYNNNIHIITMEKYSDKCPFIIYDLGGNIIHINILII